MWELWWTKLPRNRFSSEYFSFTIYYHSNEAPHSFLHLSWTLYNLCNWQHHGTTHLKMIISSQQSINNQITTFVRLIQNMHTTACSQPTKQSKCRQTKWETQNTQTILQVVSKTFCPHHQPQYELVSPNQCLQIRTYQSPSVHLRNGSSWN